MSRAVIDARPPRHALPGEEPLRRLLWVTLRLQALGDQIDKLSAHAALLRSSALVIAAGEIWLLDELRRLHREGRDILKAMYDSKSDAGPHLTELERKLWSVECELLPEVALALEKKAELHRELVDGRQQQSEESADALVELNKALTDASRVMAPLEREFRRLRELEDLQRSVERSLRDRQYGELSGPLARLAAYRGGEHAGLLAQVAKKKEAAAAICRQADLLFLRSPRDGRGRYDYTVLLRTPSEPGTQGVNIQASTTLVEQDRHDILDALKEVTGHLRGAFARRDAPREAAPLPRRLGDGREVETVLQDVGELMYRLFMPEEMQRYVDETQCSLTVTTNDLELPWELMFRHGVGSGREPGAGFLCLRRPVARLPMGHAFPRRDGGLPARRERLRFLLIHSNPGPGGGLLALPEAEREIAAVHKALLDGWGDRIDVRVLDAHEVTGKNVNRILREGAFDVIHYAGHAYADADQGDLSGLLLKDGEVFYAQKVRRLLEGRPLVFLNACQTGAVGADRLGAYAQAEGLASAFIYGGAVACIGSLWPIGDAPAAAFATAFYRHVLEGNMIGEAVRLARCETLRGCGSEGDATWASFVLYGNPTQRHTLG